jgi:hypothetical protein
MGEVVTEHAVRSARFLEYSIFPICNNIGLFANVSAILGCHDSGYLFRNPTWAGAGSHVPPWRWPACCSQASSFNYGRHVTLAVGCYRYRFYTVKWNGGHVNSAI